MNWIEMAGRLSVLLFATVVVVLLVTAASRTRPGPARSWTGNPSRLDRIDHFLLEYVGNVSLDENRGPDGNTGPDPRRDGETRVLLQEIIGEMERRRVPPSERETFLEDLRRAMRSEEQLCALGMEGREAERRFLETQRSVLAERFHAIVEDPPPGIVARIKYGFQAGSEGTPHHADVDT